MLNVTIGRHVLRPLICKCMIQNILS